MKRAKIMYLEIADQIKSEIINGKYPVGSLLPTENELEALFGVSKITVRKAIEILAADEYVEKRSGKGTTILSDRPYNKLSKAASFSQLLKEADLQLETRILDLKKQKLTPADELYAYFGREMLVYRRLYLLQGHPYILFSHHLPAALSKLRPAVFAGTSLYRLLILQGYEIESFEDDFVAVQLSEKEQQLLETTSSIGLKRIRKSSAADGSLVEYSTAIYDTARHPYQIAYET